MSSIPVLERPRTVEALLGFTSGYVDTVGFVALFGLFTAHVTGNFVLIGAAIAQPHAGLVAKLAALPVFIAAVAMATWGIDARVRRGREALRPTLAAEALLLVAFAAAGHAAMPIAHADQPLAIAAGLLGVAAMGVQNAASRVLLPELPPSTLMTGSVTQLAVDLARRTGETDAARRRVIDERLRKFFLPLVAFAAGAIAGAVAFLVAGFAALAVPVLALMASILAAGPPSLPFGSVGPGSRPG